VNVVWHRVPEEGQDRWRHVMGGPLAVLTRFDARPREPRETVRSVTSCAAERVRPDRADVWMHDGVHARRPPDDEIRIGAFGVECVIGSDRADILDRRASGPGVAGRPDPRFHL
jgi:hypothetical protein